MTGEILNVLVPLLVQSGVALQTLDQIHSPCIVHDHPKIVSTSIEMKWPFDARSDLLLGQRAAKGELKIRSQPLLSETLAGMDDGCYLRQVSKAVG